MTDTQEALSQPPRVLLRAGSRRRFVVGAIFTVLTAFAALGDTDSQTVIWPSEASEIVVRYEISGRRSTRVGTQIPVRTVYGDGLMVWIDEDAEPTPGCAHAVWTGRLDPASIQELLTTVLDSGVFELAADQRPPAPPHQGEADPLPLPLDVAAETLTVALTDRTHRVSVRPAGWPETPSAFRELRDAFLSLAPAEPHPFVPEGYRLRARPLPQENADGVPPLLRSLAELDLAAASAAPLELEANTGEELAAWLAEQGGAVVQDGRAFYLELFAMPPR